MKKRQDPGHAWWARRREKAALDPFHPAVLGSSPSHLLLLQSWGLPPLALCRADCCFPRQVPPPSPFVLVSGRSRVSCWYRNIVNRQENTTVFYFPLSFSAVVRLSSSRFSRLLFSPIPRSLSGEAERPTRSRKHILNLREWASAKGSKGSRSELEAGTLRKEARELQVQAKERVGQRRQWGGLIPESIFCARRRWLKPGGWKTTTKSWKSSAEDTGEATWAQRTVGRGRSLSNTEMSERKLGDVSLSWCLTRRTCFRKGVGSGSGWGSYKSQFDWSLALCLPCRSLFLKFFFFLLGYFVRMNKCSSA